MEAAIAVRELAGYALRVQPALNGDRALRPFAEEFRELPLVLR